MIKVTLTLDDSGNIIDVEPPEGKPLKIKGQKLGEGSVKFHGEVNHMISAIIVSKDGFSPCCIISGDRLFCWC